MTRYRIPSDYKNDVPRSNHNRDSDAFGTIHPGFLYPVHHRHLMAGERVRGFPSVLIQSQAMLGPLLQGFKYVTVATFVPDSILYGWMRNGIPTKTDDYMGHEKYYFSPISATRIQSNQYKPVELSPGKAGPVEVWPKMRRGVEGFWDWSADRYYRKQDNTVASIPPSSEGPAKVETRGAFDDIVGPDTTIQVPWTPPVDPTPPTDLTKYDNEFNHIGRGSLWDWLGLAPGAVIPNLEGAVADGGPAWRPNIAPALAYFLTYFYYFRNPQEKFSYLSRDLYTITKNYQNAGDVTFDQLFMPFDPGTLMHAIGALAFNKQSAPGAFGLPATTEGPSDIMAADLPVLTKQEQALLCAWLSYGMGAHGGLFTVPYSPDIFNNVLQVGRTQDATLEIDISDETKDVASVAIPDLSFKVKLQKVIDRLASSDGTFGSILRTLFGVKSDPDINKPRFLGVWQAAIDPTNVVASASGTADGESVSAGQMVARIDKFSKFKGSSGLDFTAREPGTLMFCSVLVPEPAYSQGLHPDLLSGSFLDDFNPEWNGIGFQEVPRHRYSMMPQSLGDEENPWSNDGSVVTSVDPNMKTVAEEPAWSWLRTDYSRLHGEFATNGDFQYWTLARRFTETREWGYQVGSEYKSMFQNQEYYGSYVNPMSWQYLFSGTGLESPNFVLMANFNLTVTNSVSKSYMPWFG
ncbi:major capsid protein [Dipodfec virus UOA04_Rod_542]|nr:major capsid protein [Dipodfec virus UOA04_Rod_542]